MIYTKLKIAKFFGTSLSYMCVQSDSSSTTTSKCDVSEISEVAGRK